MNLRTTGPGRDAAPLISRTRLHQRGSVAVRSALVAIVMLLSACSSGPSTSISQGNTPQQLRAMAMWKERCETKSGVFIHKTVEGVEGVYLVNVRTHKDNHNQGERPEDQFRLSDPYGKDGTGDDYILNFLRGYYHQRPRETPVGPDEPPRIGYRFVEAIDPKDGKLYRFTGRVEQPWLRDKSYGEWVRQFVLDRTPIAQRTTRYGVKFEDISTREEREYWIAGSSLKVIDLQTNEVLAERIGYMVDWAQGSRAGQRQPWTFAADLACPSFRKSEPFTRIQQGSGSQPGQTLEFIEQVLRQPRREQ
ncbi:hypothetical protein [Pseudorhodoferax sp.]|jgi:hypothetical protein|uniref:hypothetical protein n=1 Tax=Pseudorhodoferax sp. TaxID=1993553 RepID=UPI002DD6A1E3|nr:hypothetical protein [Pseudorhodoferax sp.]